MKPIDPSRTGKRAPRKRHTVTVCECGGHAFAAADKRQYVLIVSAEDGWMLEQFWWNVLKPKYGRSLHVDSPTAGKYLGNRLLHRCVAPDIAHIDHDDQNGLNNIRGNLRSSDKRTNGANSPGRSNRASRFKGVKLDPRPLPRPWGARITVEGKFVWLGWHRTEEDAANAYDEAAAEVYGEFAHLNLAWS